MSAPIVHDPSAAEPEAWRLRLEQLIAERRNTPFTWGSHDCALWAADAVLAVSGIDLAAQYRGTYSSDAEALRLVRELGGLDAMGALAGDRIQPLAASVGDVGVVVGEDGRELFGVCAGAYWLVPARDGLGVMPLDAARAAWRVRHG